MVESANRLVTEDHVEVVILIGAVMAGIPERIQDRVPVPVIEGMSCAVPLAEALARIGIARPHAGSFAPPVGRAVSGLSEALAARFKA
jgi:Asp/Glu/hydantoin racemase